MMHVKQQRHETDLFRSYNMAAYDEMFDLNEHPRSHYASLYERLIELGPDELERRHKVADLTMRQQGITFTVYGRDQGVERIIPFDPIRQYTAEVVKGPTTIKVYRGANGSFTLYEDDGISLGYLKGESAQTDFTWNDKTGQLSIKPNAGSKQAVHKQFKVEFLPEGITKTVAYNNKPVSVSAK